MYRLSWCDTAASTFGRLYGYLTAPLPQSFTLPIPGSPTIPLPFARRKSVAGFLAASVTGSLISFGFWRWIVPIAETLDIPSSFVGSESRLSIVSAVIGLAVGVIEGLGMSHFYFTMLLQLRVSTLTTVSLQILAGLMTIYRSPFCPEPLFGDFSSCLLRLIKLCLSE